MNSAIHNVQLIGPSQPGGTTPGHVSRPGKFIVNPCPSAPTSTRSIALTLDSTGNPATEGQSPDATIAAERSKASPVVGGFGVGGVAPRVIRHGPTVMSTGPPLTPFLLAVTRYGPGARFATNCPAASVIACQSPLGDVATSNASATGRSSSS